MTVEVGDKLPEATLFKREDGDIREFNTQTLAAGRRLVIVGVPGAFTPTCSEKHLPGFLANADYILEAGVDEIFCVAVNDPFVMEAWGESQGVQGAVTLLSDGNGEFTQALGLERDMSKAGLGMRSKRYAMVVENGRVELLKVDESGMKASAAEVVLEYLTGG